LSPVAVVSNDRVLFVGCVTVRAVLAGLEKFTFR
jgi:hypothetical protein